MTISVQGVRRHFGAVRAVDGVDLEARAGRVTALIGPNGAGKTTLLLMLAGLLVPDSGQVRVAGFDPVTQSRHARARTGWMPDAFGTWDSLTSREVLETFGAAYGMPLAMARARADELLATVHLTELAKQPAAVLSRGQKQRLGLARALVHDPQVLLLDEPAAGLDPRSRVDLRILLRSLAAQGKTVLVSSHVLTELDELADDAVFISGGRSVSAEHLAGLDAGGRQWRVTALDGSALTTWLASTGASFEAEGTSDDGTRADGAPQGSVLIRIPDDAAAAALVRDAVAAGVPLVSIAPAGGALEQTYLSLDEERR
ncbi:MAG: ABC transporter ATP-binding protein [Actinomycetota bacterium]|nr:ABC transporter ATP-binding protein [Actinomycetota bacterium]